MGEISISETVIQREAAALEAFGTIMNVPPAQLAIIIAKAKKEMRGQP